MKTTKEMIEVMQAYERGETIQCYGNLCGWADIPNPQWQWDRNDYRIKPKPRVAREWWIVVDGGSYKDSAYRFEQVRFVDGVEVPLKTIRVREILPDETP